MNDVGEVIAQVHHEEWARVTPYDLAIGPARNAAGTTYLVRRRDQPVGR